METNINLIPLLQHIDPAKTSYQEWVNVGFALKAEGYSVEDWDTWSQKDSRYHPGECYSKWNSFTESGITGATITQMAKDNGYVFDKVGHELDWDDEISDEHVFIDKNWIEGRELSEPTNWNPVNDLIKYLETLFESTDNVGYVTDTYEKDGKYLPTKGNYDRTAGKLIQELNSCKGDIGAVFGDYNKEAGAWIRFNPLDGVGVKNSNVTDYRYALVESDSMEPAKQNAMIRELDLPVACLVYSGGKSIHAIVKIDATDYKEYRTRVDYLYSICKKNGLEIDQQNRNPSRLSRMPGIIRNGKKQYLIDTNIGKSNWLEWVEWIESINDDLPEPEELESVWDNMPELAAPLIEGVLRQGHKMLIAGPSKAGKSFLLIEMCIAIAEGQKWLNMNCAKGRVLYVNLELDKASCLHRFKDVYEAMNIQPNNLNNIDIWNLRGKSIPLDKLAPKLIRRANKKGYIAIIIDPIYKVITGDENSADQMAKFCNQFDKIATELDSSVIYCHHHSKGTQGGKKSMDRASGSGVFARDPDALLDLIELSVTDKEIDYKINNLKCNYIDQYLKDRNIDYSIDKKDSLSSKHMLTLAEGELSRRDFVRLEGELREIEFNVKSKSLSGWRIDGTLREFAKFEPINLWFDYPKHVVETRVLNNTDPEGLLPSWKNAAGNRKTKEEKKEERIQEFEDAYHILNTEGVGVTINQFMEYLEVGSRNTIVKRIKEHGFFTKITESGKPNLYKLNDD